MVGVGSAGAGAVHAGSLMIHEIRPVFCELKAYRPAVFRMKVKEWSAEYGSRIQHTEHNGRRWSSESVFVPATVVVDHIKEVKNRIKKAERRLADIETMIEEKSCQKTSCAQSAESRKRRTSTPSPTVESRSES